MAVQYAGSRVSRYFPVPVKGSVGVRAIQMVLLGFKSCRGVTDALTSLKNSKKVRLPLQVHFVAHRYVWLSTA
ncbi:MAG: hypothetical protein QOJ42_3634 [Acidobacteriaceae bacterium]|nr:hypothetical protein [Acidobacteriaceae bacterium]